jgi:hypothetical protein
MWKNIITVKAQVSLSKHDWSLRGSANCENEHDRRWVGQRSDVADTQR